MTTATTDIPGIGPAAAKTLKENGFKSLQEIASATIDQLAAVPGFGPIRAGRIIKAANGVLFDDADAAAKPAQPATTVRRTASKPARKAAPKAAPTTTTSSETKEDAAAKKLAKKEQKKLKKAKKAAEKKAKKEKKKAKGKSKKSKK